MVFTGTAPQINLNSCANDLRLQLAGALAALVLAVNSQRAPYAIRLYNVSRSHNIGFHVCTVLQTRTPSLSSQKSHRPIDCLHPNPLRRFMFRPPPSILPVASLRLTTQSRASVACSVCVYVELLGGVKAHLNNNVFVGHGFKSPLTSTSNLCMPYPSFHTPTMRTKLRFLLLLATAVCVSRAQTNNNSVNDSRQPQAQPQQRSVWDEPIRFSTKTRDSCTMVVSGVGDYTRLRVTCKGQAGQSYYCDFQGKPNLCRPYNLNPRHYFTQMMWDLRKQNNACQGQKIYRPPMCKKYPDDAHMTYLSAYPKPATPKPSKPVQEPRKPVPPVQPKPVTTPKPVKPQPQQPVRPQSPKVTQPKKPTPKPAKTTTRPTEQTDSKASRLATEYCWRSFHGICSYFISWFQN